MASHPLKRFLFRLPIQRPVQLNRQMSQHLGLRSFTRGQHLPFRIPRYVTNTHSPLVVLRNTCSSMMQTTPLLIPSALVRSWVHPLPRKISMTMATSIQVNLKAFASVEEDRGICQTYKDREMTQSEEALFCLLAMLACRNRNTIYYYDHLTTTRIYSLPYRDLNFALSI